MLALERCAEILKKGNVTLEKEVLKELRDYLYHLASLQVEAENKRINKDDDEECNIVLQG